MASLGRMSAVGACLFGILTVSAGEKISLVDAIVAMKAADANPVEATSGTWSVYNKRYSVYLTPSTVEGSQGESLPRIMPTTGDGYPFFVANPHASPVTWSKVEIPSGSCYWLPGHNNSDEITFKPKAKGVYTIVLNMKDLDASAPAKDYPGVTGELFVNGVSKGSISVALETSPGFPAEDRLVLPHVLLVPGDTVKLSLTSRGSNWGDVTLLDFSLEREDAWMTTLADRVAAIAPDADHVTNPLTVPDEGTWSIVRTANWMDDIYLSTFTSNDSGTVTGLVLTNGPTANFPLILANVTASDVKRSSETIPPGTVWMHPENVAANKLIYRFRPSVSGRYSIKADVTDLGNWLPTGDEGGVNFAVWTIGEGLEVEKRTCLTNVWVCLEKSQPEATISILDREILEGETLEFRFDNNGDYSSDSTLVKLVLWRPDDAVIADYHQFSEAFRASLLSAEPSLDFTDAAGGLWSLGWAPGLDGAFTQSMKRGSKADGSKKIEAAWQGWLNSVGSAEQPYCFVNVTDKPVMSPGNAGPLEPGECVVHPIGGVGQSYRYATIRFMAPKDGVYAARARVTALGAVPAAPRDNDDGVDVVFRTQGGAFAAAALPRHETNCQTARLDAAEIWMKAGETLDFRLGPNQVYWYDETAVSALSVQRKAALPDIAYLSGDIKCTSGTTYAGAGRIGFVTDGSWTAVPCGSAGILARRRFRRKDGSRTDVRFSAVRRGGEATVGAFAGAANALLAEGLVSSGAADVWDITFAGLTPETEYTFYLYSRTATAGAHGRFALGGGEPVVANGGWFTRDGGDYVKIVATSDASGQVVGTFSGVDATEAAFNGFQVAGTSFPDVQPAGLLMILR